MMASMRQEGEENNNIQPELDDPQSTFDDRDPEISIISPPSASSCVFTTVEEFISYLVRQKNNFKNQGIPTISIYDQMFSSGSVTNLEILDFQLDALLVNKVRALPLEVVEMCFEGVNCIIYFLQESELSALAKPDLLVINLINLENTLTAYSAYFKLMRNLRMELDELLGYAVLQLQSSLIEFARDKKIDVREFEVLIVGEKIVHKSLSQISGLANILTKQHADPMHQLDKYILKRIIRICENVQLFLDANRNDKDTEF